MNYCKSYCSHGGVCELRSGHDGLHDAFYCQWSDNESLSKVEADEIAYARLGRNPIIDLIIENT